ncbi:hypothetical protein D9M71_672420 [compost metagenome]
MVIGLVSQTSPTEIGRFARTQIARLAASSICIGSGMKAANSPMPMARETERRLRCQRFGEWTSGPRKRRPLWFLIRSGSGM